MRDVNASASPRGSVEAGNRTPEERFPNRPPDWLDANAAIALAAIFEESSTRRQAYLRSSRQSMWTTTPVLPTWSLDVLR